MTGYPTNHIPCDEVIRRVWDFLDDEIDAEQRERIRAHLGMCDHCRDQYTFEGSFLRSVGRLLDDDAGATMLRHRIENTLVKHNFRRRR